ncbi:MAG: Flp pilus assembly protein CpaB [Lautropia sp.]|nr:Flp pilus assembly protein CpaB [Lautropia sp.]
MNPIISRILARHRNLLLMSTALLCGGIAVYAGSRYVDEQVAQERLRLAPTPKRMAEVVVATRPLEKGDVVAPEVMALRSVPVDYVPSAAVTAASFESLAGQMLLQPMRPGEILTAHAVTRGDELTFSSRLKPGIRALTISVDEINSISGMLQPGDRIDLLLTARPPAAGNSGDARQEATVPLLQNLLVMATGRQVRPGEEDPQGGERQFSAVTVEVTPAQAKRLIVAQAAGRLTAILRNPQDATPMDAAALDLNGIFGVQTKPVQKRVAVRRAPSGPQIIIGGMGNASAQPLSSHSLQGRGSPTQVHESAVQAGTPQPRSMPATRAGHEGNPEPATRRMTTAAAR